MSKSLKRNLLVTVGTIASAGRFERKRFRGINTTAARLLLFATLLFITSVTTAAADMWGKQFVTMTDGNVRSWTDNAYPSYQTVIRGYSEPISFVVPSPR